MANTPTRTETDTMGPVEVANDHYWGAQAERSLGNFKIGWEKQPEPIVRALGMKATVQVDVDHEEPEDGDIYMLCSDGLNGMIDDETIRKIMAENREDLEQCCNKLIAAANENGGTDNVTVVCVEVSKQ